MLDLLCAVAAGACAAWNAQKLRACLTSAQQEDGARPAPESPAVAITEGTQVTAEPSAVGREPEGKAPAAAISCSEEPATEGDELKEGKAEMQQAAEAVPCPLHQACADDAAGPPEAMGTSPGTASAAFGRGPSLEHYHMGTFVNMESEGHEADEEDSGMVHMAHLGIGFKAMAGDQGDEISAIDPAEGHSALNRSAASSSITEHYCIASFASDGSGVNWGSFCGIPEGADSTEPTPRGGVGGGPGPSSPPPAASSAGCRTEAAGQREAAGQDVPRCSARLRGRAGDYYAIEVAGGPGTLPIRKLHRRYREFFSLDKLVRPKFLGLPKLPRKSVFSKRFKPGFLVQREQGLQAYLEALMEADPEMQDPVVKAFLNSELPDFQGANEVISETTSEISGSL